MVTSIDVVPPRLIERSGSVARNVACNAVLFFRSGSHASFSFSGAACPSPEKVIWLPRSSIRSPQRSEEHTSELQSLMRISYAVFCLKKKKRETTKQYHKNQTK